MAGLGARTDSHGPIVSGAVNIASGEERAPLPSTPSRLYERALTMAAMGSYREAIKTLRDVTARAPDHAPAWLKFAELLRFADRDEDANAAESKAAGKDAAWTPTLDLRSAAEIKKAEEALREVIEGLADGTEPGEALRNRLQIDETDVAAMRLLAQFEWSRDNLAIARTLFERALSLAPNYEGARADYAHLLSRIGEPARAIAETARLLTIHPAEVMYRRLHADGLRAIGDLERALPIVEQLVREQPTHVRFRSGYAQALHFAGRREESVKEFRACLEIQPGWGEAYWGLAELRGNYLTEDDIADIRRHLSEGKQDKQRAMLLQYALGQALEKHGRSGESFAAYSAGAALARDIAIEKGEAYDLDEEAGKLQRYRAAYTPDLLSKTEATPSPFKDTTPIFIVGMPRAGSTLVEQILASHSLVEPTIELPVISSITRDLALSRRMKTPNAYPECVRDLTPSKLADLGARYLEEVKAYRKTDRPYFLDKRPWNWQEVGLIHLILPQAKIVDVRREPMAACFAMFKQMLANESASYDLNDLAHYYTRYVSMMKYWDSVLPGRVHLLRYERLVEDTDAEIRRLLDHCGLPFEERCLRFWETDRAVATPSAEQVRRPIYRDALQQWRKFEPWLEPLKDALKAAETEAAAKTHPEEFERALNFAAMSLYAPAIEHLRNFVACERQHPHGWAKLAELLRWAGDDKGSAEAQAAADKCVSEAPKWRPNRDPRTLAELEVAERDLLAKLSDRHRIDQMEALREHLDHNPIDAAAAHLLSQLEADDGDALTSLKLVRRTLELSPSHHIARARLTVQLLRDGQFGKALEHSTSLVRLFPKDVEYRIIHCDALRGIGDFPAALAVTEELLREQPQHGPFWFSYGRLLHFVGKGKESASAFRKCLECAPKMGEAYWGLADLKGRFLNDSDIAAMRAVAADPSTRPASRMYLYYALGRALEDAGNYADSFKAYQQGARLVRGFFLTKGESYDENVFVEKVEALKRIYTPRLLNKYAARPDALSDRTTPIFIVGMPRAGSTLVEQILASHSQVEGTRELPVIGGIVQDLELSRRIETPNAYPGCVQDMTAAQFAELGARYLEESKTFRKTDRPYFIDKRPWNWLEIGLINLILPHAKIIDIRRAPMAACFAMFKQMLMDGADFSYDLRDLGHYYREYAGLMEHWKSVLPGRVHFLPYERLVENTETEIRGLLDYCGLPFEEACLRFWETDRAVFTPSAEQVRRPIFRDALEQWRNFEPWLGPLKAALAEPA